MTPPEDRFEDPTPEETAELAALLVAERPRPSAGFAAELDSRVAARFAGPLGDAAGSRAAPVRRGAARSGAVARHWPALLRRRPFLPAAAATLAVGLVALVVALSAGGGTRLADGGSATSSGELARGGSGDAAPGKALSEQAAPDTAAALPERDALAPAAPGADAPSAGRKVERAASIELGADADRVDDVAQGVLGVVAHFDAIVDQSSVQSGTTGGEARFELRIPAARLQPALAALSRLPDAHVLSRTDDAVDVNQAYVSVRRRLANARAERAGVVRALSNADDEHETLRLRARLDALERTIATAERAQRSLDRRVDYARVAVAIRGDADGGSVGVGDGSFTLGAAAHDALRVLEVAAGVVVIAAAALVPLALLAALAWPLARAASRRRREHALDAA